MQVRLYDINTWKEGVDYGIFFDADGFAEGLVNGAVVEPFLKPSDVDILPKRLTHIRWFER